MKKIPWLIGTVIMGLMTWGMFNNAHLSVIEFVTAFFLNATVYLKMKLPILFFGLLMTMKKFILGLTLIKVLLIGLKRYIMDHVISTNLNNHFFSHVMGPIKEWWQHFDKPWSLLAKGSCCNLI